MSTAKRCSLFSLVLAVVLGSYFGLSPARAQSSDAALSQELSNVRRALEKYQDVVVAVRDGYFSSVMCVQDETGAGMGIHFLNRALLGPVPDACALRSSSTSPSATSSSSWGQSGSSPWRQV